MDKPDPKQIFRTGEVWRRAWMALGESIQKGRMELMMPMMVARSFSFELYLKSLIAIEGNDVPRFHDLRKLFDLVSEGKRLKIRNFFGQTSEQTRKNLEKVAKQFGTNVRPFTFDIALDSSARAFEKLRYAYEKETLKDGEGWQASEISEGTRKLVLELFPDWGEPFRHTIESR